MIKRPNTNAQRLRRHKRVRGKIAGTPERPRLNVFRSETNIYAQIIDDVAGKTLVAASSLEKGFECDGTKTDAAKKVGLMVAERAKAAGITVEVPSPNKIIVTGADKQKVGQFAAEVREKRPPEPYKGKGIKYTDEVIRRKEGKTGAKKK